MQRLLFGLLVSVVLLNSTQASVLVYTDLATFLTAIPADNYYNNFSTLAEKDLGASQSFSGGTLVVNYTITATTSPLWGLPGPDRAVGTQLETDSLITTITPGNAYWVGANFFYVDDSDARIDGTVTVTFKNGAGGTIYTDSLTSTISGAYGFYGIYSTVPIASFTVDSPGNNRFANMDNLYVSAVPEPQEYAWVAGLGLLALAVYRRQALPAN
jgi:hypothetical protein